MKKIKFILILVWYVLISGQNLLQLENQYDLLKEEIKHQQSNIDSIQNAIEQLLDEIEILKSKKQPDEGLLREKMAQVVSHTREKTVNQNKLTDQQKRLEDIKKTLNRFYSAVIDSLKQKMQSNSSDPNSTKIEQQLLDYTKKRLLVAPKFSAINFDLAVLDQIQFDHVTDSLEYQIYLDYLQTAQNRVRDQLNNVQKIRQEMEEVQLLQEKTENFVSEIDEESNFGFFAQTLPAQRQKAESGVDVTFADPNFYNYIYEQLQPIVIEINKFGFTNDLKQNYQFTLDSTDQLLNHNQYIELLKKAEKVLQDYQLIIKKKIPLKEN